MAKKLRPAPRSLAQAIDELGVARARRQELDARERELCDEVRALAAAAGLTESRGVAFKMTLVSSTRSVLDGDAVKHEMGAGWWHDHCRTVASVSVRTSPLASVLAAAA